MSDNSGEVSVIVDGVEQKRNYRIKAKKEITQKTSAKPISLTREEINLLPIKAYPGEIVLIRNREELENALPQIWQESLLGFDTETRPAFLRGKSFAPALIQLAGLEKVYLIQLTMIQFGCEIAEILSSGQILKAGVGIRDDMRALGNEFAFESGGAVDLAALAKAKGIHAQGLRTLAAHVLGFRISKGAQCSNWEKHNLSPRQILYAATDAWVGRELYLAMN